MSVVFVCWEVVLAQAKINYLQVPGLDVDQTVMWLDVSMHYAFRMEIIKTLYSF